MFRSVITSLLRTAAVVMVLGLAGTAGAATCADWSSLPAPLADLATGGDVQSMVRVGDLLYVGAGGQLLIAEMGGAGAPQWLGSLDLGDLTPWDLAVSGTTVAVSVGNDGVRLVDAADPAAPQDLGTVAARCYAVAFAGDLLCIFGSPGIALYDISTPAAPVLVGSNTQAVGGSTPRMVAREDACWMVTTGRFGTVRGFDLTDPTAPAPGAYVTASLDAPGSTSPVGAALRGNVLHLLVTVTGSDGDNTWPMDPRYYAVDASDPMASAPLGHLVLDEDTVTGLALDGAQVLVGVPARLHLLDVSDPAAPSLVDTKSALGSSSGLLAVAGDRAACASSSLRVVDLAAPAATPLLGSRGMVGQSFSLPLTYGDHLFVAAGTAGYPGIGGYDDFFTSVYDISDPAAPAYVRSLGGPYGAGLRAVVGDYLYGDGIWNWTTGEALSFAGDLPAGRCVPVKSTALYEAAGPLTVWDVSDPAAPASLGSFLPGRTIRTLAADGSLVCVVCTDELVVMDATDALAPKELGSVPLAGDYPHAALEDGLLVLAGADGFLVVDVRNPLAPIPGTLEPEPDLVDVDLAGRIAYAASTRSGTVVISLDPAGIATVLGRFFADERTIVGHGLTGTTLMAVYAGNFAYLAEHGMMYGLAPECSSTVANLVSSFTARWDAEVCRLDLRLTDSLAGVRLLATNGGVTRVVPWQSEGGSTYAALDRSWSGDPGSTVTYTLQMRQGEVWVDLDSVSTTVPDLRFTLHEPVPNPFNPSATLAYAVGRPGPVKLEIFSVDGRLVRTLVDGHRDAGSHQAVWLGRDDRGRSVAAGTYLVRLESASGVRTRKAALVK